MSERIYKCDLCKDKVASPGEDGWFRIRFVSVGKLELRALSDSQASESIICSSCQAGLREALNGNREGGR